MHYYLLEPYKITLARQHIYMRTHTYLHTYTPYYSKHKRVCVRARAHTHTHTHTLTPHIVTRTMMVPLALQGPCIRLEKTKLMFHLRVNHRWLLFVVKPTPFSIPEAIMFMPHCRNFSGRRQGGTVSCHWLVSCFHPVRPMLWVCVWHFMSPRSMRLTKSERVVRTWHKVGMEEIMHTDFWREVWRYSTTW